MRGFLSTGQKAPSAIRCIKATNLERCLFGFITSESTERHKVH